MTATASATWMGRAACGMSMSAMAARRSKRRFARSWIASVSTRSLAAPATGRRSSWRMSCAAGRPKRGWHGSSFRLEVRKPTRPPTNWRASTGVKSASPCGTRSSRSSGPTMGSPWAPCRPMASRPTARRSSLCWQASSRLKRPMSTATPSPRTRRLWGDCVRSCWSAKSSSRAPTPSPPSLPNRSREPAANFWPLVREVCDRHRVLLIADEVVTGFGRIGSEMGSRLWGVKPDMMVFAKGINSGYIPLGATMANARVCDAFVTTDEALFSSNAFLHGNTYAGHPLACVAAIANLQIIEKEKLHLNAGKVGAYLMERLQSIQDKHRYIGDVRGQGLMIGVELVADKKTRAPLDLSLNVGARISDACREAGVLLRNLADTFIISPPLTFTHANADEMVDAIDDAMSQLD